MKCPKCDSENIRKTNLHECPSGGMPVRCPDCYYTGCALYGEVQAYGGEAGADMLNGDWIQKLFALKARQTKTEEKT